MDSACAEQKSTARDGTDPWPKLDILHLLEPCTNKSSHWMVIMRIPLTIWSAENTDERQLRELITAYSRPTRLGVGSARDDLRRGALPRPLPQMNAQRLDTK